MSVLVNNFIVSAFLGLCSFLGVTNKTSSAFGMGVAVTFVLTVLSVLCWAFYHLILVPLHLQVLQYGVFIMVTAALVQVVEMFIKKYSPALYDALGIFLPLITTNCAVLGLAIYIVIKDYTLVKSVVYGFSSGVGYTLVMCMMAGIREELEFADIPAAFKGAPITLVTASLIALAFMGFAGMGK
jgi:electron transport complex protein RnfA